MDNTVLTIGLVALLGVMIFFMFRNGRKRQKDAAELQQKLVPGAEIMTSHGIFGEIISIDEDKNEAIIETVPGTRLRVHRQTIAKLVEPEVTEPLVDADESVDAEIEHASLDDASSPEFGERVDGSDAADAPNGKKTAE